MFTIEFKVKTISNCLIGNQTESFSIGGVDQATTVDVEGFPIIHGSAIKGCLRNIVREENKVKCLMPSTMKFLKEYLNDLYKKYDTHSEENDVIKNLKKTIEIYEKECKVEYIFGIEGLNTMPRLFFFDIKLKDKNAGESYFIIETKNSLEEKNEKVESRPRTYKVIRPGLEFEGNIKFKGNSKYENEMKKELEQMLLKFNDGIYGIGNSKSRGYGNIEIELCGEKNDAEI